MRYALFLIASVAWAQAALPPTYGVQTRFNSGQDIVPSFDGWYRNADGTYTMVFGYLNRNYQEEPIVAVGADNKVEPGRWIRASRPSFCRDAMPGFTSPKFQPTSATKN